MNLCTPSRKRKEIVVSTTCASLLWCKIWRVLLFTEELSMKTWNRFRKLKIAGWRTKKISTATTGEAVFKVWKVLVSNQLKSKSKHCITQIMS